MLKPFDFLIITTLIISFEINKALAQDAVCSSECNTNAVCTYYDNRGDSCCKCADGFEGNGVNCFKKDVSITVRGRISGNINGVSIGHQEMHGYLHTFASDARNYIAIGRIPEEIGKRITFLLPLVTPIHWLFAGDINNNALNGFSLTGGVFNRQSDSTFLNENGDVVGNLFVQQNFTGLTEVDSRYELNLDAVIEGSLPELNEEEQVIFPDFNQDYEYSSNVENPNVKKKVETIGSIEYRLASIRNPNQLKKGRIENNERIHFDVCGSLVEEKMTKSSPLTKLSTKRLFVSFSEGQAKFSSANYLRSMEDNQPNPCDANNCNVYAECVLDPGAEGGYYCQCKPGFDGDGIQCNDLNECEEGSTYCSPVAECINLLGYYECKCTPPRIGDGRSCEWDSSMPASDICSKCDVNSRCITDENGENANCRCNSGYIGNGFQCQLDVYDSNTNNKYPYPNPGPVTNPIQRPTAPLATTRVRLLHSDKCGICSNFATCQTEYATGGECCKCEEGYTGNGKYCFHESTPIIVSGKVSGTINNQKLDDLDLYSYVLTHTSDSRNFVAIGKIPLNLGGSFQVLISIVNPINWLFAGRNGNGQSSSEKVPNGFVTSGGLFTRTSTLTFFDEQNRQSNSIRIKQEFLGLDNEAKELTVTANTEIDGSIPNIDSDAQVVFRDYSQQYTHYTKGSIRSIGEIDYEVTSTENSQSFTKYKIHYSDEITFSECPNLADQGPVVLRVNSKRVYIKHTKGDGLVSFSSANYAYSNDVQDDPCELNTCSIYAECVADSESPNNYTCICKVGFEGDGYNCYDVDECTYGEADCDTNALCYNLVGHYECRCRSPYKGNGRECNYDLDCNSCDPNARCVDSDGSKRCICNDGYMGDGFSCSSLNTECNCGENSFCAQNYLTRKPECRCNPGFVEDSYKRCVPLPCNEYNNCDPSARCELSIKGIYECKCLSGFFGDGLVCTTQSCDVLNNCGVNALCAPDSLTLQYRCICESGFIGNGYDCVRDRQSCNVLKNCHKNAECLFDDRANRHSCKCKPGYSGDGFQCNAINSCKNRSPYEICDTNADCVYDMKLNDYVCKCKSGYEGNGLRSKCFIDESYGLHLIYAQGSSLHKIPFKPSESDNTFPHKNRIVFIPGQTAVGVSYDCHEQFIYWSDVSSNVISKIRADGSNYSVVLNNVKSAEGLAIDWISRNIYFTDSEARTIEVASLNGQHRKVLIKNNLKNPRGIAVDPVDGYIFWTDWNRQSPKIERANMDGTHRKVIVSDDIGVPNGIYFDSKRQEVCWGDAKTKRIECVEKDGSNRRIVTQINQIYPFDLTEVRSNIYWSDWSKKEIQNVDKDGVIGQSLKLSIGGNGRVYGIVAIKNACSRGTNACDRTNGNCNQLCLPNPDYTRQCACSDESNSECLKTL